MQNVFTTFSHTTRHGLITDPSRCSQQYYQGYKWLTEADALPAAELAHNIYTLTTQSNRLHMQVNK